MEGTWRHSFEPHLAKGICTAFGILRYNRANPFGSNGMGRVTYALARSVKGARLQYASLAGMTRVYGSDMRISVVQV